jgi:hypothetical protein
MDYHIPPICHPNGIPRCGQNPSKFYGQVALGKIFQFGITSYNSDENCKSHELRGGVIWTVSIQVLLTQRTFNQWSHPLEIICSSSPR